MSQNYKKFKPSEILFVALPYATGELHLGRLSSTYVPADIYRRYVKLFKKTNCLILSGLDCFGTPVYIEALKNKLSPKDYVNKIKAIHQKTLKDLSISARFDFLTTSKSHRKFVIKKLDELIKENRIELELIQSLYCEVCDLFLSDRFLSDQLNIPYEKLIELNQAPSLPYKCIFCNNNPIPKTNKVLKLNYLPLTDTSYLRIKKDLDLTQNSKVLTRHFTKWGLKNSSKLDPLLGGETSCYVWIEALYSYLEQLKRLDSRYLKKTKYHYFYGKDNHYYHGIIYPQLIPFERSRPTSKHSTIHNRNYLTLNSGDKISSSAGNMLLLKDISMNFDLVRFALAKLDPLHKDSPISLELLNTIGTQYIKKYVNLGCRIKGLLAEKKPKLNSRIEFDLKSYHQHMNKNDLKKGLGEIDAYQAILNKKITEVVKTKNVQELDRVCGSYYKMIELLSPFTPNLSKLIMTKFKKGTNFYYDLKKLQVY